MGKVYDWPTNRAADHLVRDSDPDMSRDHVMVAQHVDEYPAGAVLMESGGEYVWHDGTAAPAFLLYDRVDATAAAVRAVVNVRHTVYKIPLLSWDPAVTDPQKDVVMAQMLIADMVGVTAN